jgi:3-methyladenine DNA glycosylase AlkC
MAEPLKNLYNPALVNRIAEETARVYKPFKTKSFIQSVLDKSWEEKELKQRTRHIVLSLHKHLPVSYPEQVQVLKKVAPHFTGYPAVLFPDFIEVFGMDDPDISIGALELFTQYSTSEFAVRPFIMRYEKQMLKQHLKWAGHDNHHVRRLASEGIRPRLPWAMALPAFKKDPSKILPVLELLKNDESEYVRRSVANCLNDISKDHANVVLEIVNRWKGQSKETDWIVKHASRGLLKQGHTAALSSFGLNHAVKALVANLTLSRKKVKIGEEMLFEFDLELLEKNEHQIRVEYRIYFVKANGKLSGKIFQVGTYGMKPKQKMSTSRTHKFADLTTRKHYRGMHKLTVVVNGKEMAETTFELI